MKKKTIFITVGEDIIARNILTKKFLDVFVQGSMSEIVMLVQEGRRDIIAKLLDNDTVKIIEYKRGKVSSKESIFNSLARSGLNTHTNLWSKMRSYKRGDSSFLSTMSKRCITATFGRTNWFKRFIRKELLTIPPDDKLKDIFDTYKPDMVFGTSLSNFDFDVPVARESKQRGIKLVGMVRSWDNLSSHGLLRVVPDVFIFQNDFLVDMALKYQDITKEKVKMSVIGLPHYDDIYDIKSILEPREVFLSRFGMSANDKYILYGAMGKFLFMHEDELVQIFESCLKDKKINISKVIYRAHPKFKIVGDQAPLNYVHVDTSGEYIVQSGHHTMDNNTYLLNSIHHSELVVTGASTMVIDGVIMDKPVVCVAFNGITEEKNVDYYESVKRFYDLYTHFEDLMDQGGFKIAYDLPQMIKCINGYLNNPKEDEDGRTRIIDRFVYKLDGQSSQRLANEVIKEIQSL